MSSDCINISSSFQLVENVLFVMSLTLAIKRDLQKDSSVHALLLHCCELDIIKITSLYMYMYIHTIIYALFVGSICELHILIHTLHFYI